MIRKILRKLRENSGLTQQQVADTLNIDRSTYAYYETGKTTPDINTIIKLSKIFNVSYSEILEDEEQSSPSKVADSAFEPDELLLKYGRKNNPQIYELNKDEQQLLMGYRLLNNHSKEEILRNVYSQTKALSKKNNAQ